MQYFSSDFKVGILGGGQLGKMLCQVAQQWDLCTWIMDKDPLFPAGSICNRFIIGDFNNYEDVLAFGRQVDVITIEIEHVNVDALEQLQKEGKKVYPSPKSLRTIKDKGLQKQFYTDKGIPTAPFELFDRVEDIRTAVAQGKWAIPFVQKARTDGYDGKGVQVIKTDADLENLWDGSTLLEQMADIDKELAVIAAMNPRGEISLYPAVEMLFHPVANLVEFLQCPALITSQLEKKAQDLAKTTIETLNVTGLLTVELFLLKDGTLWVNEVAPRPHNSGHHTIESAYTSQFEQHLRAILDLPLGSTAQLSPSIMINLLGAPHSSGAVVIEGLEPCLREEGVFLHLYGKKESKPYRKMGHATILAPHLEIAKQKAKFVLDTLVFRG